VQKFLIFTFQDRKIDTNSIRFFIFNPSAIINMKEYAEVFGTVSSSQNHIN